MLHRFWFFFFTVLNLTVAVLALIFSGLAALLIVHLMVFGAVVPSDHLYIQSVLAFRVAFAVYVPALAAVAPVRE